MEGEETLDSLQSQVYSTVKLKKKSWQMKKRSAVELVNKKFNFSVVMKPEEVFQYLEIIISWSGLTDGTKLYLSRDFINTNVVVLSTARTGEKRIVKM